MSQERAAKEAAGAGVAWQARHDDEEHAEGRAALHEAHVAVEVEQRRGGDEAARVRDVAAVGGGGLRHVHDGEDGGVRPLALHDVLDRAGHLPWVGVRGEGCGRAGELVSEGGAGVSSERLGWGGWWVGWVGWVGWGRGARACLAGSGRAGRREGRARGEAHHFPQPEAAGLPGVAVLFPPARRPVASRASGRHVGDAQVAQCLVFDVRLERTGLQAGSHRGAGRFT